MNMTSHWYFVSAAYAVTAAGTAIVVVQSWAAMRAAERKADALVSRSVSDTQGSDLDET